MLNSEREYISSVQHTFDFMDIWGINVLILIKTRYKYIKQATLLHMNLLLACIIRRRNNYMIEKLVKAMCVYNFLSSIFTKMNKMYRA